MITRQISVRGRVQGVGFRDALQREARRLGVTGWGRRRAAGSVEAVLQGSPEAVEKIIVWARRGPRAGLVAAVRPGPPATEFGRRFSRFELCAMLLALLRVFKGFTTDYSYEWQA